MSNRAIKKILKSRGYDELEANLERVKRLELEKNREKLEQEQAEEGEDGVAIDETAATTTTTTTTSKKKKAKAKAKKENVGFGLLENLEDFGGMDTGASKSKKKKKKKKNAEVEETEDGEQGAIELENEVAVIEENSNENDVMEEQQPSGEEKDRDDKEKNERDTEEKASKQPKEKGTAANKKKNKNKKNKKGKEKKEGASQMKGDEVSATRGIDEDLRRRIEENLQLCRELVGGDIKCMNAGEEIKRRLGGEEKEKEKGRRRYILRQGLERRRYIFAKPGFTWPAMSKETGLSIERINIDDEEFSDIKERSEKAADGGTWFMANYSNKYQEAQLEFVACLILFRMEVFNTGEIAQLEIFGGSGQVSNGDERIGQTEKTERSQQTERTGPPGKLGSVGTSDFGIPHVENQFFKPILVSEEFEQGYTVMELLASAFVERSGSLYRSREAGQWLKLGVSRAIELVNNSETDKIESSPDKFINCESLLALGNSVKEELCTYVIPLNLSRHIVASDYQTLISKLPESIKSNDSFAFDPLPPPDDINPTTLLLDNYGLDRRGLNNRESLTRFAERLLAELNNRNPRPRPHPRGNNDDDDDDFDLDLDNGHEPGITRILRAFLPWLRNNNNYNADEIDEIEQLLQQQNLADDTTTTTTTNDNGNDNDNDNNTNDPVPVNSAIGNSLYDFLANALAPVRNATNSLLYNGPTTDTQETNPNANVNSVLESHPHSNPGPDPNSDSDSGSDSGSEYYFDAEEQHR
ncbi:hypothetical protein AX774_g3397 [Zancudomyces culisetae]|uniref:Uncharacterized protein n=1 Tax=Zancudomyces culisetae TaxID=1213189 RepID=A0A1R1PQ71_ZANCU|nr:hypothetical protein AX774_g3397 [Zancudomyces culisetae]|eukprot:OMH83099.1 hypothetical protein AX774_g3397 [Zancudomyces culisetae]